MPARTTYSRLTPREIAKIKQLLTADKSAPEIAWFLRRSEKTVRKAIGEINAGIERFPTPIEKLRIDLAVMKQKIAHLETLIILAAEARHVNPRTTN